MPSNTPWSKGSWSNPRGRKARGRKMRKPRYNSRFSFLEIEFLVAPSWDFVFKRDEISFGCCNDFSTFLLITPFLQGAFIQIFSLESCKYRTVACVFYYVPCFCHFGVYPFWELSAEIKVLFVNLRRQK